MSSEWCVSSVCASVCASPEIWGNVYPPDEVHWSDCNSSPPLPLSILALVRRKKQEATRGFLTSWPSDMIESARLPKPDKRVSESGVGSWLGLHVTTDRVEGRRKGEGRGGNGSRQKEHFMSCMYCMTRSHAVSRLLFVFYSTFWKNGRTGWCSCSCRRRWHVTQIWLCLDEIYVRQKLKERR